MNIDYRYLRPEKAKALKKWYDDPVEVRGNPGPGGFGTVMHFVDANGRLHVKELSAGYRLTTNNRMELMGAIAGLEALKRPCVVEMWTDSQYVVNAFNKNWIAGWVKRG